MRRAGVDIGINQQVVVAWAVLAPSRGIRRGDLAGNYVGAAASATVGVGVGANALIGGSSNTIALQPLSVQAQTGLSVAAGVAGLELRARPLIAIRLELGAAAQQCAAAFAIWR